MRKLYQSHLAIIQVVTAVIIWAAAFVAMKIAVTELGSFNTVFLRMLLAVAVLAFFLPRFKKDKESYQQGDWVLFLGLILCEPCLYFVFEGLALKYTSASEAGMITSLHPFLVTLAAFYWLKESITKRMVIGGLCALSGAILLSLAGESHEAGSNNILGNILELIAICFATVYSILARKLGARYSPIFLTSLQAIFGTLFFLPLALAFDKGIPAQVSTEAIFSILFLAWGVNVVAFTLYNASLRAMPASQVGMWMNLLPLATLLLGWLMLDEVLTNIQYVGVLFVIGGLIYSQLKPKTKSVFIEQSPIEPADVEQAFQFQEEAENQPVLNNTVI